MKRFFLIFFICVPLVMCGGHTAQGEMNSEGVFGLQRGFKKAGANRCLEVCSKASSEYSKILGI